MAAVGVSSVAPVADDNDDCSVSDMNVHAPAKALAAAQDQEHARVTLGRAMTSLIHMLEVRGYAIRFVGNTEIADGVSPYDAAKEFDDSERARCAEADHEIILEGEVVDPAPFTTAWAKDTPVGTKIIVVIITKGNVGVMREVLRSLEEHGTQHVILVSRFVLTPYSKKWINEYKEATVEFFTLMSLQGVIDRHKLVPKHTPLNASMMQRVKDRYKNARFPKLPTSDPMVQYLGLDAGMMVSVYERMGREQAAMSFFEVAEL